MKKVKKYVKKAVVKGRPVKYLKKAWEEILEEAEDFFDDFYEDIFRKKKFNVKIKQVKMYGTSIAVRPAYIFAQRIEGLLHFIIGISVFISAMYASFAVIIDCFLLKIKSRHFFVEFLNLFISFKVFL